MAGVLIRHETVARRPGIQPLPKTYDNIGVCARHPSLLVVLTCERCMRVFWQHQRALGSAGGV